MAQLVLAAVPFVLGMGVSRVLGSLAEPQVRGEARALPQQHLARRDGRLPQYRLGGGAVPLLQHPGAPPGDSGRR